MSDFTPYLPADTWCPACDPDPHASPRASAALCRDHAEAPVGSEDAVVSLASVGVWGEANAAAGRGAQAIIR